MGMWKRCAQGLRGLRRKASRGSAALELSLSMPVLFGVTAGVVEFGEALVLRQQLVNAASEAARIGTQLSCPRATEAEARAAAAAALADAGLEPSLARIVLANTGGPAGTDMIVEVAYEARFPMLTTMFRLPALADGKLEVAVHVEAENE